MITVLLYGLFILVGIALGAFIITRINGVTSWYLPSVTNAKLSRELQSNIVIAQAYQQKMSESISEYTEAVKRLNSLCENLEVAHELVAEALTKSANRTFREATVELREQLSTHVLPEVVGIVSQALEPQVLRLGSEFVLLHDLSDCEAQVTLTPRYVEPLQLVEALKRAVEFAPLKYKRGEGPVNVLDSLARNEADFQLWMGKFGEVLWNLQWEGTMALKAKASSRMTEPSLQIVNTPAY